MQKIERITPGVCNSIRTALNPEIQKMVAQLFGLKAEILNGSYTDKSVTFKLEIKAEGIPDIALQMAKLYGWPAVGTKFTDRGKEYEVVDYDIKRRTRPIICCLVSNLALKYCFNAQDINRLLNLKS